MRQRYFDDWQATSQTEARELLFIKIKVLDDLFIELQTIVEDAEDNDRE